MKTILCYGDSNTWGYDPASSSLPYPRRHPLEIRWTGRLAKALGDGYRIVEEGVNGRTTVRDDPMAPGRNGKEGLVIALEAHKPIDLVVLMLGTNDLKTVFSMPTGEIAGGVGILAQMILGSLAGPDDKPPQLLIACPPAFGDLSGAPELREKFGDAQARSLKFPPFYESLASSLGISYLNTQELISASPVDGIHLDAEAHETLALAMTEKVRSISL
jgi:lysophospholipase L1-like esterase